MLEPEEFVARWEHSMLPEKHKWGKPNWKRSPLVRFTPSPDASFLPESSRRFLMEAGLPSLMKLLHFGKPNTTLPPLPSVIPPGEKFPSGYGGYRVLAIAMEEMDGIVYYLGFLCFHSGKGSRLFLISTLENNRVMFVNSSVEQFAEYLLVMRDYSEWHWSFFTTWDDRIKAESGITEADLDKEDLRFKRQCDYKTGEQFQAARQVKANETIERLRQIDPAGIEGYWSESLLEIEYDNS